MPLHLDFRPDIRFLFAIMIGIAGMAVVLLASNKIDLEYESIDHFITARTEL